MPAVWSDQVSVVCLVVRLIDIGMFIAMKLAIRQYVLRLHRWTGLTVGLVIVLMAVTGASILFRPQLEPIFKENLLTVRACVGHASLDMLTTNAVTAHPSSQLSFVRVVVGKDTAPRIPATSIRFTDKTTVYLDPCTGAVLGQERLYDNFFGIVESLHRFRYLQTGSLISGTCAMVFGIVLILGGLFMWWPATRKDWGSAVKFNSRLAGPARTLRRHKTIGFYASFIVLISVLTGLPQAFDWYKNGIYAVTGSPLPAQPPKSIVPTVAQRLTTEAIWQRTQLLVPQLLEAQLRYPSKPSDSVEVAIVESTAPHPNARSYLYLDAYTGKTLRFTPYFANTLGRRVYMWTISMHTGLVGGVFGKLFLLIGALSVPVLAYTGISSYFRKKLRSPVAGRLSVRVVKKTIEAQDICTFELAALSGNELPPFGAGSHIDVYMREGLVRQYSLCNDPRETHRYLIGVLRDPKSRGGSRTMHDEIQEGDVIEIGEPKNHFPLVHSAKRSLLLAGGIGVTPILCMAERLANIGADFEMHYRGRSLHRMAFVDRIRRSTYANRVSMHVSDGAAEQLVDIPTLLLFPDPGTHLYVCGPTGFMDVVIDTAKQQGWADANVHREYFAAEVRTSAGDVDFDVKIASTGKIFHIAHDKTVLEALSERGIVIPNSCRQGVCGTCLTRVLDGSPDHRDMYLNDDEREKNDQFLPCCSRARSAMLVLDL